MELSRLMYRAALVLTGVWRAGPAFAQSQPVAIIAAKPGAPARLGVYANVGPDCRSKAPPKIEVDVFPAHGALALTPAKLKTARVRRCGEIELEAIVVIYRSAASFRGEDLISYSFLDAKKIRRATTFRIRVQDTGSSRPEIPRSPDRKEKIDIDI